MAMYNITDGSGAGLIIVDVVEVLGTPKIDCGESRVARGGIWCKPRESE